MPENRLHHLALHVGEPEKRRALGENTSTAHDPHPKQCAAAWPENRKRETPSYRRAVTEVVGVTIDQFQPFTPAAGQPTSKKKAPAGKMIHGP
jgi:hypothetical protein